MLFITRKFGKLIFGNATPAQLMLACVLGAMIGFMPGLWQAAGTIALLTLLLVMLNANLVLAALVGLIAKGVALLLLPASFAVGRVLLDGPTQPLFAWAINAPVLALFGFEYYATTGGLVLGALFGLGVGFAVVKGVRALRRKLAALEEGSAAYQQWTSKRWVRLARWVLVGGAPKGGYQAALERHGKVIRPLGLIVAAGIIALLVLMRFLFADEIVTLVLQRGLERANGATVDMRRAELDLGEGRLVVEGLAMADPNDLKRNVLSADTLTADVSTTDLLRKRLTLDQVTLNNAATGEARQVPGRLIGDRPKQSAPPETDDDERRIEDYLEDWQTLKERLAQIRRWLERVGDGPAEDADEKDEPEKAERKQTLEQRLRQRIAAHGYAGVAANHLIASVPTFTVRRLDAEKVRAVQMDGELLNVHGENLSTHPGLLDAPPKIRITTSDSDRLLVDAALDGISQRGGDSRLKFHYKRLPVDAVTRSLRFDGGAPLQGGTLDLALDGALRTAGVATLDAPLRITVNQSKVRVGGRSQSIDTLPLSLHLRGPLDNPAVALDEKQVAQALAKAGATQLAKEALKDKAGIDVDKALGGKGDAVKKAGEQNVGGLINSLTGKGESKESSE